MSASGDDITVDEAVELVGAGAYLLDVREDNEFAAGHAALATHLTLSNVPDAANALPRDRVIVCVCRSGGRSGRAAAFLAELGYDSRNVAGGMVAWVEADYPITSDEPDARII